MTILHISDTHNQHSKLINLPPADVLVHSGDITFAGSEHEVMDFINWFSTLPYKHKIFIAGNHDCCLYGMNHLDGLPSNVHYLCKSGIEIDGIRFYGIPMFMEDYMSDQYIHSLRCIPQDTDILITHHCDPVLLQESNKLHLKYILCGHEHDQYGKSQIGETQIINSSLLDNKYNLVHDPTKIIINQ